MKRQFLAFFCVLGISVSLRGEDFCVVLQRRLKTSVAALDALTQKKGLHVFNSIEIDSFIDEMLIDGTFAYIYWKNSPESGEALLRELRSFEHKFNMNLKDFDLWISQMKEQFFTEIVRVKSSSFQKHDLHELPRCFLGYSLALYLNSLMRPNPFEPDASVLQAFAGLMKVSVEELEWYRENFERCYTLDALFESINRRFNLFLRAIEEGVQNKRDEIDNKQVRAEVLDIVWAELQQLIIFANEAFELAGKDIHDAYLAKDSKWFGYLRQIF